MMAFYHPGPDLIGRAAIKPSCSRTPGFVCLLLLCLSANGQQVILRYDALYQPVASRHGMVVSQRESASQAGAAILAQGGNAVDAAVAVGFELAVSLPRAGNIGGGGFMLIHRPGREPLALDFRETAPAAATTDMFINAAGETDQKKYRASHAAAGVPGTVAGLLTAHKRFGRLPLDVLLAPAMQSASKGVVVSYDMASAISSRRKMLTRHPATAAQFFREDGSAYQPGDLLRQPELARSLERIAQGGKAGFYEGETADLIVREMVRGGGLVTHADLMAYEVAWCKPVTGRYRGFEIVSMPPPSSGGVHLVQMLNMLEHYPVADWGFNSAKNLHLLTEVMKIAYADRSRHLGDPDFFEVPVAWLTGKPYAAARVQDIDLAGATPSVEVSPGTPAPAESADTTHYSIVDADGGAVAVTYTLNFSFGSGITVPGAGFLLNNEMTDFSARPGEPDGFGLITGKANRIQPRKRPLSAMTPTFVYDDGALFLVAGSPGGSRIINVVLQTLVNVIDHGMNIAEAVNVPRIHHQWLPDQLNLEPGISPDTASLLGKKGHRLVSGLSLGSVQAIQIKGGEMRGASDPRRPGGAAVGVRRQGELELLEVRP